MKSLVAAIAGVVLVLGTPLAHAQDPFERALLKNVRKLVEHLQSKGYQNVGVLKFLVAQDGRKFSDNVGTLNITVALQVERALVLARDMRYPIEIIENASKIAHKIPDANHLTKEGRVKLLSEEYPAVAGKAKVRPDAFVTGTVAESKDLKTLTISLLCFDRKANMLMQVVDDFNAANSLDRLAESGHSFLRLRGAFDDGKVEDNQPAYQEKVYQEVAKVRDQKAKHPAQYEDAPVTLEVRYDNHVVPFEFRDGKAFIAEPREGQTVTLRLGRDRTGARYGVVLKVNGENTLEKERAPDLSCLKWVLDPGAGPWEISGFHIGDHRERFRVASVAESKQKEFYYGADVGTITMTVFREQNRRPKPATYTEEQRYETAIKKLVELPARPENYEALKAQLLADANRGLIVPGAREPAKVETVPFTADPNPIMVSTIVYYRK